MKNIINSNTDWEFVKNTGVPEDGNSIICLFSGTINKIIVKIGTYHQYYASPMEFSRRNEPAFKEASIFSVDKATNKIISKVEN